jgi:hypothetical protein
MFSEKIPGTGSAYWVSGITQANPAGTADVDVVSLARADELPPKQVIFDGVYSNTARGYLARMRGLMRLSADEFAAIWHPEDWEVGWQLLPLTSLTVTETDLPQPAVANGFALLAYNTSSVTLDPVRMKLDMSAPLTYQITSDSVIDVHVGDQVIHFVPQSSP